MLFRKNIDPRCDYCQHGQALNEDEVVCVKKGVMCVDSHCRHFRYDAMKRVPPRPVGLQLDKLKEEDFSL